VDLERLRTPREVAEQTGLSYHAVLRAIHRGDLLASRLCGRLRIRPCDVDAWIDANRIHVEGANFSQPALFTSVPSQQRGSLAALRALEEESAA
jgi:excisionase family DNA binding protein